MTFGSQFSFQKKRKGQSLASPLIVLATLLLSLIYLVSARKQQERQSTTTGTTTAATATADAAPTAPTLISGISSNLDLDTGYTFDIIDVGIGDFKPVKRYGDYRSMGHIIPGACTVDGYSKMVYVVAKNQTVGRSSSSVKSVKTLSSSTSNLSTSSAPAAAVEETHLIHIVDAQSGTIFSTVGFRDLKLVSLEFDHVQSALYGIVLRVNNETKSYESELIRFDSISPNRFTSVMRIPNSLPVPGVSTYCDKKGIMYFYSQGTLGVLEWIKVDVVNRKVLERRAVDFEITSMRVINGQLFATVVKNVKNQKSTTSSATTDLVELDRNSGAVSSLVVSFPGQQRVNGGVYLDLTYGVYYVSVSQDGENASHIVKIDLRSGALDVTLPLPKVALCMINTM